MRRTTRAFALMQHSNFDILYTSHTPFETFHWFVYMVVELHAHWNKHLLNVNFSYGKHCWWLTSRTCVNTLINETNVKCEATTLSIWDIAIHLEEPRKICRRPAIRPPLSAVTVSLHYLPRCMRSTYRRSQGGGKGAMFPQIFRKSIHFVL